MKFKVTEIKEFSESISLDSLKDKFLSEGWLEENGTFTKDGKTITPISESKGKYLDELEEDESLSDKARKDFSDLSYDQKWSDGSEKLAKELEKRAKDLEKKHKVKIRLDGITNESFNKSVFNKMLDKPFIKLYEGLNDIETVFNYLKSSGQGGIVGSFKKKIQYIKVKKLIEEIDAVTEKMLSESFKNKKEKLENTTFESFNRGEFDKLVDSAIDKLYEGLNEFDNIFKYLKSSGQGGIVGSFKKDIKYDTLKKLLNDIEKSVGRNLRENLGSKFNHKKEYKNLEQSVMDFFENCYDSKNGSKLSKNYLDDLKEVLEMIKKDVSENFDENQTEVNKHVKVRFNGRVSVYFSDGSEVYTSPKDGSFEYGGVRFLANYNKGLLGLHDVMKDMNNAFDNITFELVQDLKSTSIFEAVEKADIEKVKDGTKLQLSNNIQFVVKGKSKYGFKGDLIGKTGKIISVSAEVPFSNFSNPHYNKNISIVENFSHKLVNENVSMELSRFFWDILTGFQPYNLIWEENGKYCFGKKDHKGDLETYVAKGADIIKFAQSIFKLAKKGSKINFTHVEVNNGNIAELMVSNKNKGKKYSNEKLDEYGNKEGIEDVSVGNTPYTYILLKEKPIEEGFDDVFEKKGDLVKDNPNAGKLLANWIGLSKLEELNTFTDYHKLLPQIEQCLVDIKKGKEKSHKCIYKIISDNILKTELFDDDKKSLDRSINAYKKYGFVLL